MAGKAPRCNRLTPAGPAQAWSDSGRQVRREPTLYTEQEGKSLPISRFTRQASSVDYAVAESNLQRLSESFHEHLRPRFAQTR